MELCKNFAGCGFFKKYEKSYEAASKHFIDVYCRGSKKDECKRKEYAALQGTPAPENMMPNGVSLIVKE